MKDNEFSSLLIVVFVAFASMGAVSILGGIYKTIYPSTRPVECSVEVARGHVYVGLGEIYE